MFPSIQTSSALKCWLIFSSQIHAAAASCWLNETLHPELHGFYTHNWIPLSDLRELTIAKTLRLYKYKNRRLKRKSELSNRTTGVHWPDLTSDQYLYPIKSACDIYSSGHGFFVSRLISRGTTLFSLLSFIIRPWLKHCNLSFLLFNQTIDAAEHQEIIQEDV